MAFMHKKACPMLNTPLQVCLEPYGIYNPSWDPMSDVKETEQVTFVQRMLREWLRSGDTAEEPVIPQAQAMAESRKRKGRNLRRKPFKKRKRPPFYTSPFMQDYDNPLCQFTDTREGKEFRINYRMPWVDVRNLVRKFDANPNWIPTARRASNGKKRCPLPILIMGTLYWLGEGCSWRNIENVSGRVLTKESFRKFAHQFFRAVATHMAPKHIRYPKTIDEVRQVHKDYEMRGFPGAIGSVDGVQIAWEGCPWGLRQHCTGKEKYPTVGFNVTVDHAGRCQHATPVMPGRYNDLTKSRFDEFIIELRAGKFADFAYTMYTKDGGTKKRHGPYLICDGGYHAWVQLMTGSKHTAQTHLALWSTWLEVVRKDVERFFGIMKKRFRVLKVPMLVQDVRVINDLFLTCCTLHNILLDRDAPFGQQPPLRVLANKHRYVTLSNRRRLRLAAKKDWSYRGYELKRADPDFVRQRDPAYEQMRDDLAQHYHYMYRKRLLKHRS